MNKMNSVISEIAVRDIDIPSHGGIRKYYETESMEDLSNSISEHGTIYPLIVKRKTNNRYELIAGSRRLRATKNLGIDKVQAVILDNIDDQQAIEIAFIENVQRQDLTPFEEARVILKLINDYKVPLKDVSKRIGRTESYVRRRLQLLSLPKEIQKMIAEKKISIAQVDMLASLSSAEEQKELADISVKNDLSDEDLHTLISEKRRIIEKPRCTELVRSSKKIKKEQIEKVDLKYSFTAEKINLKSLAFARWLDKALQNLKNLECKDERKLLRSLRELIRIANKFINTAKI